MHKRTLLALEYRIVDLTFPENRIDRPLLRITLPLTIERYSCKIALRYGTMKPVFLRVAFYGQWYYLRHKRIYLGKDKIVQFLLDITAMLSGVLTSNNLITK